MGLAVLFLSVVQYTPNFHIKDKLKCQVRFEWLTGFRLWRQYWRQYWGYIFFGGISPSKIGHIAPFFIHDSTSFKNMWLLI
jgi:hypothetical protein